MARILAMPSWPGRMKADQDLPRSPAGIAMSFAKLKWRAAAPMPPCLAAATSTEMASAGNPVDGLGQGNVLLAQSADVMGREPNGDLIVAVGPVRMMPCLLGGERHPCHESKGLGKILEPEVLFDGALCAVMGPAPEALQTLVPLHGTEFYGLWPAAPC